MIVDTRWSVHGTGSCQRGSSIASGSDGAIVDATACAIDAFLIGIDHVQKQVQREGDVVLPQLGRILGPASDFEAEWQNQVEHERLALGVCQEVMEAGASVDLMICQLKPLFKSEGIAQNQDLKNDQNALEFFLS